MPFLIPNAGNASFSFQAEPDSVDFGMVTAASGATGVVSGCGVAASGSPAMNVVVSAGSVLVSGVLATVAGATVAITSADPTNPRFDLIVSSSAGALSATAGTPAAHPVFPAIPASSVVLASVYVPAAATSITNSQIVDKRITVSTPLVVNVLEYGAAGNGTNDDTSAINNAIAAVVSAGGGEVYFPAGTYKTTAAISITGDNVTLRGAGWASIIKPAASATFDVIATPIPASAGLSGFVRNYLTIERLMLDCSNMTGTVAGQGNGIHFYGVRYSFIRNVYIKSCPNWAVLLDGDNTGPGNNFGFDNSVRECIFDLCNANVYQTNCEANRYTENQFKWAGTGTAAGQPALGTQDTTALHLRLGSGYAYVAGNVFGKGGTYTTEAIRCSNSGPCRMIGNRFDQVRYQAVTLNGGNHMFAFNQLGTPSEIGTTNAIQIGSSNNVVIGNVMDTTAGAAHHTYAIAESGGPFTGNVLALNRLITGSSGTILTTAGSTHVEWGNISYGSEQFKGDAIPAVQTTTYQILDSDNLVYTDSTSAAFTVTLPNARLGLVVTIKDKTGQAGAHNITINTLGGATVDGGASGTVKITTNYGVLRVTSDGTNWFTI